jgi:hypothetical protein
VLTKLGDFLLEFVTMFHVGSDIVGALPKAVVLALEFLDLPLEGFVLVFELIAVRHVLVYNSRRDTCHPSGNTHCAPLHRRGLPIE